MSRDQIVHILAGQRNELREKYAVQALYLFGSTARGTATYASDVDLLVEFSKPVGLFHFIRLQLHLESLLNTRVDLGTRDSLKPALSEQVEKEAIRVA
ncbi:MAG: nucleotidyltransferase family protein [Anaerolineae bacterium]